MKTDVSDIVEVSIPIPERTDGDGVCPGGVKGGHDAFSMIDRAKRVKNLQVRLDFRECIPCDRCGNCLEMRRFLKRGEERVMALYCLVNEMEVTPFHTCNTARRTKHNRKKVVYYMENAPEDFKVEAARLRPEVPYMAPGTEVKLEPTIPRDGYRGGSNYYKRADGDSEAKGSGKIPKGLMN